MSDRVFLIGYRGTGKTTVARVLAERLGWLWIDADQQIERRAGKTIREIFAEGGEQAFRDLEAETLALLAKLSPAVIALGGGAVLREENRQILKSGTVIWLQADVATIATRIADDPGSLQQRPNLTASGGVEEIRQLLDQRTPIYRQCADYEVATQEKTPPQIADQIVGLFERGGVGADKREFERESPPRDTT